MAAKKKAKPKAEAKKKATTAKKMIAAQFLAGTGTTYRAYCSSDGYKGPARSVQATAWADANAHRAANPTSTHQVTVIAEQGATG